MNVGTSIAVGEQGDLSFGSVCCQIHVHLQTVFDGDAVLIMIQCNITKFTKSSSFDTFPWGRQLRHMQRIER